MKFNLTSLDFVKLRYKTNIIFFINDNNKMEAHIKLFGVTLDSEEETLYKKYRKLLRNTTTEQEKKVLKKMYKELIENLEDIKDVLVKEQPKNTKLTTRKEFEKLNNALNEDPELYQKYFLKQQQNTSLFNGIRIDKSQEKELVNVVGKGKSFNREKFNQIFDEIKGKEPVKNLNYDELNPFNFNNMTDDYQDVASYGGVIAHMGEVKKDFFPHNTRDDRVKINLDRNFEETYKPREYYDDKRTTLEPVVTRITSQHEFLDYKKKQLYQESERNKEFIKQNAFLFNNLNLDEENDRRNEENINWILNG